MTRPFILLGKIISSFSKITNLGSGSTWPGEIALMLSPNILREFFASVNKGIIIIAGTNGKTTTAKMVREIIAASYPTDTVVCNESGANLLNGIAAAFIQKSKILKNHQFDWTVIEVDENTLPLLLTKLNPPKDTSDGVRMHSSEVLKAVKPKVVISLLNLFRDQLDRYGEVDTIANKWLISLKNFKGNIHLVANSDDPAIAYIGLENKKNVIFFGIDEKTGKKEIEHATDSIFCPRCGHKLIYEIVYYSHIGLWSCAWCALKRPKPKIANIKTNLPGSYNLYNIQSAVLISETIGLKESIIRRSLQNFTPAFGRQEEFTINGKKIKIFLSKNPVGFNESLKTVIGLNANHLLLVLNDRIPDGKDISWIWDVDFEMIPKNTHIIVSGERCYDLGLRLKYADKKFAIVEDLKKAIELGFDPLFILPTYSAMLEVRKILTGKKIL